MSFGPESATPAGPKKAIVGIRYFGPVAQLARASALQAEGQEFESPQVHQTKRLPYKYVKIMSGSLFVCYKKETRTSKEFA